MIQFKLKGSTPSGKNAITVTRSGLRFPNKRFVDWRKDALSQIIPPEKVINEPVSVIIRYSSADLRRRDMPGILDALWHLMEKGFWVTDDTFLGGFGKQVFWDNTGKSTNPGVNVELHNEELVCLTKSEYQKLLEKQ